MAAERGLQKEWCRKKVAAAEIVGRPYWLTHEQEETGGDLLKKGGGTAKKMWIQKKKD